MNTAYYNGNIYVERGRFVTAMYVKDGIIEKIGTDREILANLPADATKTDLGGKTVVPGINDSHLHIQSVGQTLSRVMLNGTKSVGDMISAGREFLKNHTLGRGDVLLGHGWNQDYFTDEIRMPTRYDLDEISKEIPIIFTRACGHICVANSKALELAGITKETEAVAGGVIYKDENGQPNGLISENSQYQVSKIVPRRTVEKISNDFIVGMKYARSQGITSLQSNDIKVADWQLTVKGIEHLYATYPDALRLYEQCNLGNLTEYKKFLDRGYKTGTGDDMFKYGPLKLFVDGSLGARTALMRKPYADDDTTCGVSTISQEDFNAIVKFADDNGCQVVTHCIGDGAIDLVLNGYESVIKNGENKNRHRGIHVQITDREMLQRFKDSDILAEVQPIFIDYDMNVVEDRVGRELANQSYAFGDLFRMGVHVSYGTDSPVEDLNPWHNIYCAVTRKNLAGTKTYRRDQKVDIYDAVDMYTTASAYASFEENKKGRLLPGYFADFAVLDRNIFQITPEEVRDTICLKTVLAGRTIYEK